MSLRLYLDRAFSLIDFSDLGACHISRPPCSGSSCHHIVVFEHDHGSRYRRRRTRLDAQRCFSSVLLILANVLLVRLISLIFPESARSVRYRDSLRAGDEGVR